MSCETRVNQETSVPEININGVWVRFDFLEDAQALCVNADEFYKACTELFTDDIALEIKEFLEQNK